MPNFAKPNRNKLPASDQNAADYYAEIDLAFNKTISELAALLEWKETTVAGFIFEALKVSDWRGYSPAEIAETHLRWQNENWETRAERRRGFLLNIFREK